MYEMADALTGNVYGSFYLDLFPRPGKFTWFAVFPLIWNSKSDESSR